METQIEQAVLEKARRRLRFRRGLRRFALVIGILAVAGCIGEFCALRVVSARIARLEVLAGLTPQSTVLGASSEASAVPGALSAERPAAASPVASAAPASTPAPTPETLSAGAYEAAYPALYATPLPPQTPPEKTVYLTFDDGPSGNTEGILDILSQYGVKGTWFLVGSQLTGREALVRRMAGEQHTIALHSDTHEYSEIYASPEAFLADLDSLSAKLTDITGQRPALLRFAGGSVNSYDAGSYTELTAEVVRRGLRYYDWNVSAQDAVKHSPAPSVIAARVIQGVERLSADTPAVVLMHDSKATTPQALPEILSTLSAAGYTFAALDSSVPMVAFSGGEKL